MILVVADTGPIRYLVVIEAIGLLPKLYDQVVLPGAVFSELTHPNAPAAVRNWAASLPQWAEVQHASRIDLSGVLDPGEAEAIALASELKADSILLDESEGRNEAIRQGLLVSGTLGVLEKAAERDLVNLSEMFSRLTRTNFRITRELIQEALARDRVRREIKKRDRGLEP